MDIVCFFLTHLKIFIILVKYCVFFLLNMIIHEHNVLGYNNKNDNSKGGRGGLANPDRADKGERGVGEMLTMADKVGGRVWEMLTMADKEGRGSGPHNFWLT